MDRKKSIEESIEDYLNVTGELLEWFFGAKKSSKCKATKSISRCHGYHKTYWWNMWRGTSKKLFNLQETDQRVNNIT